MTTVKEDFENGSLGTNWAPAAPWTYVSTTTATSASFVRTSTPQKIRSVRLDQGVSGTSQYYPFAYVQVGDTNIYQRAYYYFSRGETIWTPGPSLMDTGFTSQNNVRITYSGGQYRFVAYRNAGASSWAMASTIVPIGAWFRLEWFSRPGNSYDTLRIFTGAAVDSTTPTEEISTGTAARTGYDASPGYYYASFLNPNSLMNNLAAWPMYVDDMAVSDIDWIGPETPSAAASIKRGMGIIRV